MSRHETWLVQILLITELMQGGDLRKRIKNDTARPRATGWYSQGRFIALGIVRGLVYLHEMGFIWFDCKPNNVLLDHTQAIAKIADFGLAKILTTKTHTVGHLASFLDSPLSWLQFTDIRLASSMTILCVNKPRSLPLVMVQMVNDCWILHSQSHIETQTLSSADCVAERHARVYSTRIGGPGRD